MNNTERKEKILYQTNRQHRNKQCVRTDRPQDTRPTLFDKAKTPIKTSRIFLFWTLDASQIVNTTQKWQQQIAAARFQLFHNFFCRPNLFCKYLEDQRIKQLPRPRRVLNCFISLSLSRYLKCKQSDVLLLGNLRAN